MTTGLVTLAEKPEYGIRVTILASGTPRAEHH
jgi:hypothetical protein